MVNNKELREIIWNKREEGYSFIQIAEFINEEYGVKKSRQAINGIYKRELERRSNGDDNSSIREDIFTFYVILNKNVSAVERAMEFNGNAISKYKINEILEGFNHEREIREEIIDSIKGYIKTGENIEYIKNKTMYKGVAIEESMFRQFIGEGYKAYFDYIIESKIIRSLNMNINSSIDMEELVKSIINHYGLKSSYTVLKNKANKQDLNYNNMAL